MTNEEITVKYSTSIKNTDAAIGAAVMGRLPPGSAALRKGLGLTVEVGIFRMWKKISDRSLLYRRCRRTGREEVSTAELGLFQELRGWGWTLQQQGGHLVAGPRGAYGLPRTPVESGGFLWAPTDSYGSLWVPMECCGSLWVSKDSHGSLWDPMGCPGPLLVPIGPSGPLQVSVGSHGPLWDPTGDPTGCYWSYGSPWAAVDPSGWTPMGPYRLLCSSMHL